VCRHDEKKNFGPPPVAAWKRRNRSAGRNMPRARRTKEIVCLVTGRKTKNAKKGVQVQRRRKTCSDNYGGDKIGQTYAQPYMIALSKNKQRRRICIYGGDHGKNNLAGYGKEVRVDATAGSSYSSINCAPTRKETRCHGTWSLCGGSPRL